MRLVDIYFPDSPLSYQLLLSRLGKIPFHPFVLIQKDQKIKAGGHFPAKLGDGRFRAFRAVRKTSLYGTLPVGSRTLPYPRFATGNVQGRKANCSYITVT
jgi:hypothetical protein